MNTMFLLMAEFETSAIPSDEVAERYLGMKKETASKKADAGDLPIPSFRLRDSQKSPRLVHIKDLAEFIDKRQEQAKKDFEYFNK